MTMQLMFIFEQFQNMVCTPGSTLQCQSKNSLLQIQKINILLAQTQQQATKHVYSFFQCTSPLSTSRIKMAKFQKDKKVGTVQPYYNNTHERKKEREKGRGGGGIKYTPPPPKRVIPHFIHQYMVTFVLKRDTSAICHQSRK